MSAIVTALVTLLGQLLPLIGSSEGTAKIIETLVQILPALIQEAQALVPMIKNIINALQADPTTTADQLATLQALDEQCDAAFEAAAVDPAADAAG